MFSVVPRFCPCCFLCRVPSSFRSQIRCQFLTSLLVCSPLISHITSYLYIRSIKQDGSCLVFACVPYWILNSVEEETMLVLLRPAAPAHSSVYGKYKTLVVELMCKIFIFTKFNLILQYRWTYMASRNKVTLN